MVRTACPVVTVFFFSRVIRKKQTYVNYVFRNEFYDETVSRRHRVRRNTFRDILKENVKKDVVGVKKIPFFFFFKKRRAQNNNEL